MMRRGLVMLLLLAGALSANAQTASAQEPGDQLTVGSKKFTEAVILGEVVTLATKAAGVPTAHRKEIGGTRVLWSALIAGEIDAYVEYTGTLLQEVMSGRFATMAEVLDSLAAIGIEASEPLGFNNTYVLGMREAQAEELGIVRISDLLAHPALRLAFGSEFMDRQDGWPSLRTRYRLPHTGVRGMDHDLAYQGINAGQIDVVDLYSTDAEIAAYNLRGLEDDLGLFPEYKAIVLYRADVPAPMVTAIRHLEGQINAAKMVAMNARVRIDRESDSSVAAGFLQSLGIQAVAEDATRIQRLKRTTMEHLYMVGLSLLAAILLAIPLGVLAARGAIAGSIILGVVGVIYTIPALALLVFMIPLLGIGAVPAMVALFLYSLLPIVRNTHAGLTGIPMPLRESAEALGLGGWTRLRKIELPLASPSILAGIKTAAVINIGTATLGALIGAGGYGQPILTGIRLNNVELILEGAVPAALLALVAQGLFGLLDHLLVPRGLRIKPEPS
ncbi:MAG: osmoprotectant transport system permease protein [Rhodothermales bacterium]|jgi:osmoprotectant transport system permease protein